MKLISLILLSMFWSLSASAFVFQAKDIPVKFHLPHDDLRAEHNSGLITTRFQNKLYIEFYGDIGMMLFGSEEWESALSEIRKNDEVILVLDSFGGAMAGMLKIRSMLNDICEEQNCKLTSYVPSGSSCQSACIGLFLIGQERRLGEYGYLKFHRGAAKFGDFEVGNFKFIDLFIQWIVNDYDAGLVKALDDAGVLDSRKLKSLNPEKLNELKLNDLYTQYGDIESYEKYYESLGLSRDRRTFYNYFFNQFLEGKLR